MLYRAKKSMLLRAGMLGLERFNVPCGACMLHFPTDSEDEQFFLTEAGIVHTFGWTISALEKNGFIEFFADV